MFVNKWQQLCAYTQSFLFSELNERNMEKKVAQWKQDFTSSAKEILCGIITKLT